MEKVMRMLGRELVAKRVEEGLGGVLFVAKLARHDDFFFAGRVVDLRGC